MNGNTRIDFIYLSEPDMIEAGVTDMPACIDCMEEMFKLIQQGDYRMAGENNNSHGAIVLFPKESNIPDMPRHGTDRRFMAMPAYLGGQFHTAGVKWYGSNTANRDKGLPRSILMFTLSDVDTGAPLAIMSANLLSAYRTGAIPGVGARHLARPDSRTVGILGPGVMARTTLQAFAAACPQLETVKIKGRGQKSLDEFKAWVGETLPQLEVVVVDSLEEVVRDSDLVTFCAAQSSGDPATYPTVRREWVKPGAFLAMPAATAIDAGMEQPDVRKVADNIQIYEAWFEECSKPAHWVVPMIGLHFMDMIAEGRMRKDQLEDLAPIVSGLAPGRRNDEEIILMSVGGMAIEDVAWATTLYRKALQRGIGVPLNLWETPALR